MVDKVAASIAAKIGINQTDINIQSVGSLVPGIRLNIPDVGGAQQTEQTYMASHGNSALHTTILLDGMPAQTNLSDGAVQNYIDNALIAEATYQTSGVSAETSAGGVRPASRPFRESRRRAAGVRVFAPKRRTRSWDELAQEA